MIARRYITLLLLLGLLPFGAVAAQSSGNPPRQRPESPPPRDRPPAAQPAPRTDQNSGGSARPANPPPPPRPSGEPELKRRKP